MPRPNDVSGDTKLDGQLFKTYFGERTGEPAPPFSSDVGIAWVLLQRIRGRHRWVELIGTQEGRWICRIHDRRYSNREWIGGVVGEGANVSMAICRAALAMADAVAADEKPAWGTWSRDRAVG